VTIVTHDKRAAWLLLTFALPARPTAGRMRVWRQLQRLGAIPVKGGAYVLPHTDQTREDFEWLRGEIVSLEGDASLFAAAPLAPAASDALVEEFREARAADFAALVRDADGASRSVASDPAARRTVRQLAERLAHLQSIDFFGAEGGGAAADAVAQLSRRSGDAMVIAATPRVPALKPATFRTRTWVTRPRPGIDRFATAWLIRRFINRRARIVFAADADAARKQYPRAVPFDMFGVELGHQGSDCTFETMMRRFRLRAPGLDALARLVHAVDLKDDRFVVPEAATVTRLVEGLRRLHEDDDVLLERGIETIDALYRGR